MTEQKNLPPWLLERAALGEVPRHRQASAEEGELAELEQSNAEILAMLPPERVAAEIERRMQTPSKARATRTWLVGALIPLAAVTLLLVLQPRETDLGTERVKGLQPQLVVYRRGGARIDRLEAHAVARAGDVLQLRYVAARARQGVVLSLDGAGHVTLHWPLDQKVSAPLQQAAEVALPNAYQLDRAPAFERFFFVTSDHPFAVEEVLTSARELARQASRSTEPLSLPADLHQTSLFLEKAP